VPDYSADRRLLTASGWVMLPAVVIAFLTLLAPLFLWAFSA
jgi:hypothetical protein